MTQLKLSIKGAEEGVALRLPATPAEVSEAVAWFDRLGMPQSSIHITGTNSPVRNLNSYVTAADISDAQDVAKLNELAKSIEQMDAHQHSVFAGALDAESIDGLDDVIRVSKSQDQYILYGSGRLCKISWICNAVSFSTNRSSMESPCSASRPAESNRGSSLPSALHRLSQ